MIRFGCNKNFTRLVQSIRGIIVVVMAITSMTCIVDRLHAANERVFQANFGRKEDKNRDGWPDVWRRTTDRDHPRFVSMKLSSRSDASEEEIQAFRKSLAQWWLAWKLKKLPGQIIAESIPEEIDSLLEATINNPFLEVQMNGGAALIEGADFAIDPQNAYRLHLEMACTMTDPFIIQAHLVWLDKNKRELAINSTKSLTHSSEWKEFKIDEVEEIPVDAKFARVRLTIKPVDSRSLKATIRFDRIFVDRVPRLEINLTPPTRIIKVNDNVRVEARLNGVPPKARRVRLRLTDCEGNEIGNWIQAIQLQKDDSSSPDNEPDAGLSNDKYISTFSSNSSNSSVATGVKTPPRSLGDSLKRREEEEKVGMYKPFTSTKDSFVANWKIPIRECGFYRLHVDVLDTSIGNFTKSTSLIALPSNDSNLPSMLLNPRIGWSLPELGKSIRVSQAPKTLEVARAGRVKFSLWLTTDTSENGESLNWMVETLANKGITSVGVIEAPITEVLREKFPFDHGSKMATLLDYPKIWQPMYEPLWSRASLFLTQFQVGWDHDDSISLHSNWEQNLEMLSKHIRSFGPETRLTIPHDSLMNSHGDTSQKNQGWDRYLVHTSPPLTSSELNQFSLQPGYDPRQNWINIDPLESEKYSLVDRVQDLTERMIAIHQNQWETAWVSNPSDPRYSVLDSDGGPEEMFLPLRVLTECLNNAEDFFSIPLGDQVKNIIYRSGNEDRMIVWSDKPITLPLYVGNEWTAIDIWGRPVALQPPKPSYHGIGPRVIKVGLWPVILKKINRTTAQWLLDVKIENPIIENRVGAIDPIRIYLKNPTHKLASGKIEIFAPTLLEKETASSLFSIEANAGTAVPIPIQLKPDASQTSDPVDIYISIEGTPPIQFGVKQPLNVGLKDFKLVTESAINEQDELVIQITMTNQSGESANFDCMLLLPDQPRKRIQLINLVESSTRTIIIDSGSKYRGQSLWLRCEEIGSGRVLNQRIPIK